MKAEKYMETHGWRQGEANVCETPALFRLFHAARDSHSNATSLTFDRPKPANGQTARRSDPAGRTFDAKDIAHEITARSPDDRTGAGRFHAGLDGPAAVGAVADDRPHCRARRCGCRCRPARNRHGNPA